MNMAHWGSLWCIMLEVKHYTRYMIPGGSTWCHVRHWPPAKLIPVITPEMI